MILQQAQRQIVTIDEPFTIRTVLEALCQAARSEISAPTETLTNLEGLAKLGCESLILNVRIAAESVAEGLAKVWSVRASLVGGVLVVSCVAAAAWLERVESLSSHFGRNRWFL